ncbi:TIGR03905 family TSCPD domain-containing protein [Clostridium sp. DJ247]|uniref:TIGR03905 family TSCPD domain-containing protein n=1 Tax=Clostridium sp. DJ247 TaxID=2726188 RepID=UPI0016270378|nr:TIGR03905 family TSCPD domain-containing protein [Clostridium sp. DJ247]MBC2582473.1 TIGR03905 family TSCPD domain-containing protein [Clostridium sp. DJ247]
MYSFKTNGVCAKEINFDVVDNKVTNISFIGGCNGNLQGVSKLLEGMNVKDIVEKLNGINCGSKGTSCPDQFARALKELVLAGN